PLSVNRGSAALADVRGTATLKVVRGDATLAVVHATSETRAVRTTTTARAIRPHLILRLAADRPEAAAGDLLTYTLALYNDSPVEARAIVITDYLPREIELVSTRGATPVGDAADGSLRLKVNESLQPGAAVRIQIVTRVKPS